MSGIGLVNCTFVANTNRADAGGVVADVFARSSTSSYVLNDILWNDDSDYAPFARTDSGKLTVGRTVAKNYDASVPTAVMGFMKADEKWLNVSTRAFVAADKLPTDLELLPDAWGQARRRTSSSLGALNAPPTGLMLMVR